jgi:hypothetical protein
MKIITKTQIQDDTVVIEKGITGFVVAVQWGDQDGFIVNFPQHSKVFVKRENASIVEEKPVLPKSTDDVKKKSKQDEI